MLHASKFVNTKAYQKAQDRRDPLKFPLLSGKDADTLPHHQEPDRVRLRSVIIAAEEEAKVEMEKKANIHPSVDLEKMKKIEDLNKQEEDWMAFFSGKGESVGVQSTESAQAPECSNPYDFSFDTSYSAETNLENDIFAIQPTELWAPEPDPLQEIFVETLEMPDIKVPDIILQEICEGPHCLNEIFAELDDKFRTTVS